MYLDEFHCVIWGNEPAGLWLLARLAAGVGEDGKPPAVAWLRTGPPSRPIPIPISAAAGFGIETGKTWHLEVVTPRHNLEWRRATIEAAFPGLPDALWQQATLTAPRPKDLSVEARALQKHPELLAYAMGVWKALGRTPELRPEVMLWSSLLATELGTWDPAAGLPPNVAVIDADTETNELEEVKMVAQGALSLKFRDLKPIVARRWVVNSPYRVFRRMSRATDALVRFLTTLEGSDGHRSLYRLDVEAERAAVPFPVPPTTVAFDTELIPDWDTEIWPFDLKRTEDGACLGLLASAPPSAPLDAVLDRFRSGLRRLNRLFPFLSGSLRSLSSPLSLETCYDDESRSAAAAALERDAIELYAQTSLHTTTRHKSLSVLFPSLHCALPYPVGPLTAARPLVSEILGKPKARADATAAPPPT